MHGLDQLLRAGGIVLAELAVDGVQLVKARPVVGDGRIDGQGKGGCRHVVAEIGRGALTGGVAQVYPLFAPALVHGQDVGPGRHGFLVVAAGMQLEKVAPGAVTHSADQGEVFGLVGLVRPHPGGAAFGVGGAVQNAVLAGGVADGFLLARQEQAIGRIGRGRAVAAVQQGQRQALAMRAHAVLGHAGGRGGA
ncbi:hypothetical protein D3C87_1541440 [compost metagenome]